MGSVKDSSVSSQIQISPGPVMEDSIAAEPGSNPPCHGQQECASCEATSSCGPPQSDVCSTSCYQDAKSCCQPETTVKRPICPGETSNVSKEQCEYLPPGGPSAALCVNAEPEPLLKDISVKVVTVTDVLNIESDCSVASGNQGAVMGTLNRFSDVDTNQDCDRVTADNQTEKQGMGVSATLRQDLNLKVSDHEPRESIKDEVIQETSLSQPCKVEKPSLDTSGDLVQLKGSSNDLLDDSKVITNTGAIKSKDLSLKEATNQSDFRAEKPNRDSSLHEDKQKSSMESTADPGLQETSKGDTQVKEIKEVPSPNKKVYQFHQEKLVKHPQPTGNRETQEPPTVVSGPASNAYTETRDQNMKQSGELTITSHATLEVCGTIQETTKPLQVETHDQKNALCNGGQKELRQSERKQREESHGLGETRTKLTLHVEAAKDSSGEAVGPCLSQNIPGVHAEIQVSLGVPCRSAATSPMTPPEGSDSFFFPVGKAGLGEAKPAKKDAELQVGMQVESRSVATAPMTPGRKSPQASYPEIHIKGVTEDDQPEPVREVRWDEKGMTWEVYGASMEVEVLGMAIQKHLEKQIEEHGKQPPPQSLPSAQPPPTNPELNRASSVKGALKKAAGVEKKRRQRNPFRAVLQNLRRPQCCSRANTIE
ncbi:G protein-regulated inducer of neurite outgrowth 1-like [Acipenser ruthenus]|uniref:G protein-regulated inducer of neurite outgrowth 1-like n=1 Tax=Acipenser ruthenus TaxID=7906 RepID=UPI00145BFD24|nr:G protein-regulated inducer of neurite outgrowth 1-like [Acipenser ruthenus]XP_034782507.1 G protein-regulated inducer of neurite outgrowth 1-like [Acipenser ruthenus]